MIRIQAEPFDPSDSLKAFMAEAEGVGAVVSFTGVVRGEAAGDAVSGLHLEHYAGMTEREIAKIEAAARERWPIEASLIIHRYGDLRPGEAIVFVATAAAHRRAAFEAADFLMDYLKTDAPFWKKEAGAAGERWIEPRAEDRRDRARWTAARGDG